VCNRYPDGLTDDEYLDLIRRQPEAQDLPWRLMLRGVEAYGMGDVHHRDHRTVHLPFWHRILPNRENVLDDTTGITRTVVFFD